MPALTEQNHEARSRNVSASEVGALMGVHPYSTPGKIWDRLTSPTPLDTPSEAMALGSWFEAPILRFAQVRDGFRARLNSRTYEHRQVRLCATPDAFVIGKMPWEVVPSRSLVEIKMSARHDRFRDLPKDIEWQARAQMAVLDRDTCYVYALVGMSLKSFAVYRDEAEELRMIQAVHTFWTAHILTKIRPTDPDPEDIQYEGTKT